MACWTCGTCWRDFGSYSAREQHLDACQHHPPRYECDTCSRYFGSRAAVAQHMDALDHWEDDDDLPYQCDESYCFDRFETEEELNEHNIEEHWYCDECDRYFDSRSNIRQHLNSRVHRDETAKCPFCGAGHVSTSAVMCHLEGGQCQRAPMNRDEMYLLLRSRDPMGYFTKHIADFKPTERYEVTASAYNHKTRTWQCYFCHRGFNCQNGLNNHLNSPVHQQRLYHCPNKGQCGREFTTLAGVFSHLESESCSYMRFDVVQQKLENITAGMGLLK